MAHRLAMNVNAIAQRIISFMIRAPLCQQCGSLNVLPIDAWQMFDRFRTGKTGKGWTGDAKRLAICKLQTLRDQGHDPAAVIEQSVLNGWAGLFELNAQNAGFGPPGATPKFDPLAYVNRNRTKPSLGGYDDGIIDV